MQAHIQYALLFVSDMGASVAFWRDAVGIPLRFESPEWTEFATEGATLALHATPTPASVDNATNPAGTAQVGFNVADLAAFHARMDEQSVECLQPPTPLHGVEIAKYRGPDGAVFTVAQSR